MITFLIVAFMLLMLFIGFFSFIAMFDARGRDERMRNFGFVCVGSMIAFVVLILFLDA